MQLESRLADLVRELYWADTRLDKLIEIFAVVECSAFMEYFSNSRFLQPRPHIRLAELDELDALAEVVWRKSFRQIWYFEVN